MASSYCQSLLASAPVVSTCTDSCFCNSCCEAFGIEMPQSAAVSRDDEDVSMFSLDDPSVRDEDHDRSSVSDVDEPFLDFDICESGLLVFENEEDGVILEIPSECPDAAGTSANSSNDEDDICVMMHKIRCDSHDISEEDGLRNPIPRINSTAKSQERILTTTTWNAPIKTVTEVEDSTDFYGRRPRSSFAGRAQAQTDHMISSQIWRPGQAPLITGIRFGY